MKIIYKNGHRFILKIRLFKIKGQDFKIQLFIFQEKERIFRKEEYQSFSTLSQKQIKKIKKGIQSCS